MSDCLFCAISAGEIPSAELYETEQCFAFLDINPLREGHALVVPKIHAAKHGELPANARGAMWDLVAQLTPVLCEVVGAQDANIAINDGPAAGQEIAHCHVHIVPRKENDGGGAIHAAFPNRPKADMEQIHDVAIRVQRRLA